MKIYPEIKRLPNKISSINEKLKSNTETVENAKKRYAELAQEVENLGKITQNQGTLSTDEYEEFLDLSNQLAGIFPSLTKNYDDNGNAILNLSGDVNTIVGSLDDLIKKEKELANQKIMEEFPDVFSGFSQDLSDAEKDVTKAKNDFEKINNIYQQLSKGSTVQAFDTLGSGFFTDESGNKITTTLGEYTQALEDLGIAYEQTTIKSKGLTVGYRIEATDDISEIFTSKLESARQDLQYAQQQLEGQKSSLDSYLNTWLQTEFSYNQIEDVGLQSAIQDMLFNFNWSNLPKDVDKKDWNEVSEYLRRNILFAINNVQNNPDISNALSEIFSNAELTPDEKANYIKQIQEHFGKDNIITISLQPHLEDTELLQKQYNDAIGEFGESAQNTLESFFKENSINDSSEIDYWNEVTEGAHSAEEAVRMYNEAKNQNPDEMSIFKIEDFSNNISEITSAYDTLSSAVSEYNTNGAYSLDTMSKLLSLKPEYLALLVDENGQLALNEQGLRSIVEAQLEQAQAEIYATGIAKLDALAQEALGEASSTASSDMESSVAGINAQTEALNANAQATIFKAKADEMLKGNVVSDEDVNAIIKETETQVKAIQNAVKGLSFNVGGVTGGFNTKSVEDATKKTKEYIDSYMEFQKKSLENGTIDYKTYCNNVSNLLKQMYSDGKIAAQDYHSYTQEMLEVQKDIYDKAISGIAYIIDKEVESLEKQKESIESTYKTKIDAIQSEIDLRKKVYEQRKEEDELNDAIYNKERARNQKTNLQFVNGQMVYTPDGTAIKDAEETLADKKHEMEISQLESQIESLEKAMESEIETIDKEIKKYEEYKKQIQDVAKEYENAENVKYALAVTGLNSEAEILECRIDVLNTFRENYIAIQKAISDAAWESARAQVEAQKYLLNNSPDAPITIPTVTPTDKAIIDRTDSTGINVGKQDTILKYHDGINKGYVGEGVSKDKRLATLKEIANGTAKLNLDEVPAILKKGEVVLTDLQQDNIIKFMAQNPIIPNVSMPKYDYTKLGNRNDNSVTMNGDINITCPGVTSQEVVRQVDAALRHEFFGMANKARQKVNITR